MLNNGSIRTETQGLHKSQTFFQIILPLVLTAIIIVLVAVMVTLTTGRDPMAGSSLSSISLIFMLLPLLFLGLLGLLILILFIFVIQKITAIIPGYALLGQFYISVAAEKIRSWADLVTDPVLKYQGLLAGFREFIAHIPSFLILKLPTNIKE